MGRAVRWFKGLFGLKIDSNPGSGDGKSRIMSCFGHSGRETDLAAFVCHNPATIPPNISPAEAIWLGSFYTDKEQSKHAIAVAAATAAAADAAVTAAQAAAAVVRLTSKGKDKVFGGGAERLAAVRIQTFFRGFLARKALRALKGLVKIQALVRGFLVRKQATETLKSMQALIRAQATVRSQKVLARMSMERFDDGRREHLGSIRHRRLSVDPTFNAVDDSPKIVEVDTGRPKSRSRRTDASISGFGDDPLILTHSSPFPYLRPPCRMTVPEYQSSQETECFFSGEECRFSTAQNTPRFMNSGPRVSNTPGTPSRSVCGETLFRRYGDFPNYMSNTKSFRAKLRSYSAPKQRPEPEPEPKKKVSLKEMMESRSLRIRRSQVGEAINFKNAVMGNLDRSGSDFGRETERYSVSGNMRDMVRGSPGYIHNI